MDSDGVLCYRGLTVSSCIEITKLCLLCRCLKGGANVSAKVSRRKKLPETRKLVWMSGDSNESDFSWVLEQTSNTAGHALSFLDSNN